MTFIVAEAGLAHGGNFDNAIKLIDLAYEGGADAVKFQLYNTEELINKDRSPEWFDRFKRKEMPYEYFGRLKQYASHLGIMWFATPHTESAIHYLESIDVPIFKVGSGEHNFEFIKTIADLGKPLFISTGLRTQEEVFHLIDCFGKGNVTFLHCVTAYPVLESRANLGFLPTLKRYCATTGSAIGYSDHTGGTYACELAAAMGATVIEKHICLDSSEGQDVFVSLKGKEVREFVDKIRRIESILGSSERTFWDDEKVNGNWALKKSDGKR